MKIDLEVERAVRKAFAGAVAEEPARFNGSVLALAAAGEDFAKSALSLALDVDAFALFAIHEGQEPDEAQRQYLAQTFARHHAWANVDNQKARAFIDALSDQRPVTEKLSVPDTTEIAFLVGAWLLSAFLPEGKDWVDFLDEIEDALEGTPTPD